MGGDLWVLVVGHWGWVGAYRCSGRGVGGRGGSGAGHWVLWGAVGALGGEN